MVVFIFLYNFIMAILDTLQIFSYLLSIHSELYILSRLFLINM